MKLSNEWFTALSQNDDGAVIVINGRDDVKDYMESGKYPDRIEITWKYEPAEKRLPSDEVAKKMEEAQTLMQTAMEKKDRLAIMTAVYTGDGEKVWVFYARNVRAFGERLNEALQEMETLPLSIYTEADEKWEEYLDMYEMKQWAVE